MGPESLRAGAVELGCVDEGLIDVDVCHLEVVECGVVGLLAAGCVGDGRVELWGRGDVGVEVALFDARELWGGRAAGVELCVVLEEERELWVVPDRVL